MVRLIIIYFLNTAVNARIPPRLKRFQCRNDRARGVFMLRAFKDRLKELAADPEDTFRFSLRKRVGKRATQLFEKRLRKIILLMPGLISRAYRHWQSENASPDVKKLGGFLLTYLYHPRDFLPEEDYAFFGYLDDAYLVLIVYESVLRDLQRDDVSLDGWDQEFLENFPIWKKSVRQVIPDEAGKIEAMLKGILESREDALDALFRN